MINYIFIIKHIIFVTLKSPILNQSKHVNETKFILPKTHSFVSEVSIFRLKYHFFNDFSCVKGNNNG